MTEHLGVEIDLNATTRYTVQVKHKKHYWRHMEEIQILKPNKHRY